MDLPDLGIEPESLKPPELADYCISLFVNLPWKEVSSQRNPFASQKFRIILPMMRKKNK